MKQLIILAAILFVSIVTFAQDQSTFASLDKVFYKALTMQDNNNQYDLAKGNASMTFNTAENKVTGKTSCNSFFGSLTYKDQKPGKGKLKFGALGGTKMACVNDMVIEQVFYKLMEKVNSFEINGNKLYLKHDKEILFELIQVLP